MKIEVGDTVIRWAVVNSRKEIVDNTISHSESRSKHLLCKRSMFSWRVMKANGYRVAKFELREVEG